MSILILKEKHNERYYSFGTHEELELLAGHIVRERHNDGWYDDTSNKYLRQALEGDNKAALKFLYLRATFEYEAFDTIEPETVDSFKGDTV